MDCKLIGLSVQAECKESGKVESGHIVHVLNNPCGDVQCVVCFDDGHLEQFCIEDVTAVAPTPCKYTP